MILNVASAARSEGLIATQLGASVITAEPEPPKSAGDPWAAVDAASASSSVDQNKTRWILAEIEKVTSRTELKKVWASNQPFFADPAVMVAYKAKGKALPA
ncbi:hypothetical protein [Streptomyces sp. NPDC047097]|uniref:hypothetical protein n=1 Tax=Streptomyces sp. NPDC047097 TaxID=3155260 RepID=UPI0033EE150D